MIFGVIHTIFSQIVLDAFDIAGEFDIARPKCHAVLNGGFRADFNFRRGLALRIQQRRRVALVIPHAALIGADVIHQLDTFAVHFAGIHNAALLRRTGEGYAAQLKRRRILLFARIQHGIAQLGRRFSIKLGPSFCAAGGIGNQFLINLHAVRKPLYLLVKRLFLLHVQLSRISGG